MLTLLYVVIILRPIYAKHFCKL